MKFLNVEGHKNQTIISKVKAILITKSGCKTTTFSEGPFLIFTKVFGLGIRLQKYFLEKSNEIKVTSEFAMFAQKGV